MAYYNLRLMSNIHDATVVNEIDTQIEKIEKLEKTAYQFRTNSNNDLERNQINDIINYFQMLKKRCQNENTNSNQ